MSIQAIFDAQAALEAAQSRHRLAESQALARRAVAIDRAMRHGVTVKQIAQELGVIDKRVYAMRQQGDYFTRKATQAMMEAGAPDADVTAIANWARQAHTAADRDVGVIVDADGTIQAHTDKANDDQLGKITFISDYRQLGLGKTVLDAGLSELSARLNRKLVHLSYTQLTEGAGAK